MINIAIQPCGDSDAIGHYQDTIMNPVSISRILPFLSATQQDYIKSLEINQVAIWGVTRGQKDINKNKWDKLNTGDIALLYKNKSIFSQGKIISLLHSKELATELWNLNKSGETWEYIYFLDDLQEIEIPIVNFNKALDYKPNNIIQGFNVLVDEKARIIADLLELDVVNNEVQIVDNSKLKEELVAIQETDNLQQTKTRQEQPLLRKYLFQNKRIEKCHLCNKDYPVSMLVAAHIKKRASCNDDERKDFNVVMSACKFGCDELFEKSYININDDGYIQVSNYEENDAVSDYIKQLIGKKCSIFNAKNKEYFKWHREHKKRFMK